MCDTLQLMFYARRLWQILFYKYLCNTIILSLIDSLLCDLATSPSYEKSWCSLPLSLGGMLLYHLLIEWSGNDAVWFLKLGHTDNLPSLSCRTCFWNLVTIRQENLGHIMKAGRFWATTIINCQIRKKALKMTPNPMIIWWQLHERPLRRTA